MDVPSVTVFASQFSLALARVQLPQLLLQRFVLKVVLRVQSWPLPRLDVLPDLFERHTVVVNEQLPSSACSFAWLGLLGREIAVRRV